MSLPPPDTEVSGDPLGFRPGSLVGGKFRIERIIAEGGMGLVVAATHLDLDQLVALKFFRAEVGSDRKTLLERFTREAKAAARLKSEHVARVLDVSVTDDGRPYMVIEYLEGQSLDRLLEEEGPLDVARAVEYAAQACEGLAEAHARGIVHRDIKPSNLFLVRRPPGPGIIKILDFGISKLALSDASNFATNIMMGTPCYMSPEQIRSTATVDHRADIWSLGATLYQLLAGKAPFDASRDLLALAESIVFDSPQPLDEVRPDIPRALAAVIGRCLSKDRNARFSSTGELALALLPFAGPRASGPVERAASMSPSPQVVTPNGAPHAEMGAAATQPQTVRRDRRKPNGQQRGLMISSAVAALVLVVSWTINLFVSNRSAPPLTLPARKVSSVPVGALESPSSVAPAAAGAASQPPVATRSATEASLAASTSPTVRRDGPSNTTMAAVPTSTERPNALLVRVSPSMAQILVDGVPVAGNPFRGSYSSNGFHELQATARGYVSKKARINLDGDLVVDLTLERRSSEGGGSRRSSEGRSSVGEGSSAGTRGRERAEGGGSRSVVAGSPEAGSPASSSIPSARRQEVDPAGGREPLRPIEVRNPYGAQ